MPTPSEEHQPQKLQYGSFDAFCEGLADDNPETFPVALLQEIISIPFEMPTTDEALAIHAELYYDEDKQRQLKNWKQNETKLLIWIIVRICVHCKYDIREIDEEIWESIQKLLPQKTAKQCRLKWYSLQRSACHLTPWTPEEDCRLSAIVKKQYNTIFRQNSQASNDHIPNMWTKIADELNDESSYIRNGKKCRERWINKLNPQVYRQVWREEEQLTLLTLVLKHGKRWQMIGTFMGPTRSQNDLKNQYYSLIKKGYKNVLVQSTREEIQRNQLSEADRQVITTMIERLKWRLSKFKHKEEWLDVTMPKVESQSIEEPTSAKKICPNPESSKALSTVVETREMETQTDPYVAPHQMRDFFPDSGQQIFAYHQPQVFPHLQMQNFLPHPAYMNVLAMPQMPQMPQMSYPYQPTFFMP